jgi:hypothetical protein
MHVIPQQFETEAEHKTMKILIEFTSAPFYVLMNGAGGLKDYCNQWWTGQIECNRHHSTRRSTLDEMLPSNRQSVYKVWSKAIDGGSLNVSQSALCVLTFTERGVDRCA